MTVRLWVKDAQFDTFAAYEKRAFALMARHGGKVLSVEQTHGSAGSAPDEIHVLEFPGEPAFASYRNDPEVLAMADQREACIEKTEVEFS